MATFVLVHGAWAGGWCWKLVTPFLRAAGHEVYPVTLTGLGERAHLASPSVDLDTHIRDVTATIEFEDLHDVVLVGHSYGCMVITGAYQHVRERIARMVYLDGPVPRSGQSVADTLGPEVAEFVRKAAVDSFPPPAMDDAEMAWYMSHTTPQPAGAVRTPVIYDEAAFDAAVRTFILCTLNEGFATFADPLRSDPAWHVIEIVSDHFPMVRCPEKLANLLMADSP